MSNFENYNPDSKITLTASQDGDRWMLVIDCDLAHSSEQIWSALTDPELLKNWSPFDADSSLNKVGATVKLTTVGAPGPHITETNVTRAEAPRSLDYDWGGQAIRWQLEPIGGGTQLTLTAGINHRFIAMGAAGWHLCLSVKDRYLSGNPIGRIVASDALKCAGWQRLHKEYAEQFGL